MTEDVLGIVIVAEGIVLLCMDFGSYAYRKLTESMGLGWGCISIVLILLGAVPGLSDWCRGVPREAYAAFILISIVVLLGTFCVSCSISQLIRKNRELAMHVSLLNQENERILHDLEVLREQKEK